MTFPSFSNDIPETISIHIRQSPSVNYHVSGGAQNIRLVVEHAFENVTNAQILQILTHPAHTVMPQHTLIQGMIHQFNPSFTQLAVLSQLQVQPKIEKVSPSEKSSETKNQRDEVAPMKSGKTQKPIRLEVFKGEKGEGSHLRKNILKKLPANQKAKSKLDRKVKLKEKTDQKIKGKLAAFDKSNSKQPELKPSKELSPKPEQIIKEEKDSPNKETELTTFSQPESEVILPEAQDEILSEKPIETSKTEEVVGEVEVIEPAEVEGAVSKSMKEEKGAPVPVNQKPPKKILTKKESADKTLKATIQNTAENKSKASSKNSPNENKTDPTINKEKVSPPDRSTKISKEISRTHEEPGNLSPKTEVQDKESKASIPLVDPEVGRMGSSENAAKDQQRIIQNIDTSSIQVPAWLAALLPNLVKSEFDSKKGGGNKAGKINENPHKLVDMLFMLLCASLCGAKTLLEIIRFIETREKWFKIVLGLQHGLPPRQLFFWLLAILDSDKFSRTIVSWLYEVQGRASQRSPWLHDIIIWQTSHGFIIGQKRHPEAKCNTQQAVEIADGFLLEGCVIMTRSDSSYGSLLTKIKDSKAEYLAESQEELHPSEFYTTYESYLEGQERTVLHEWQYEGSPETYLKAVSEFNLPKGITHLEEYYIASFEDPSNFYFELSRLQRPYANKTYWLMNIALNFPSIDETIRRCNATLKTFHLFALEILNTHKISSLPVEEQMKKATINLGFLLKLVKWEE